MSRARLEMTSKWNVTIRLRNGRYGNRGGDQEGNENRARVKIGS